MFTNDIYLIYMNKPDLAVNNLRWLICNKTKGNQIIGKLTVSMAKATCNSLLFKVAA